MIFHKSAVLSVLALVIVGGVGIWMYTRSQAHGSDEPAGEHHPHHEEEAVVHGPKVVTYRGENYVLPVEKVDYTDEQAAKIEQIILTDKPPLLLPTYQELMDYLNTIEAPGYGSSTGGFGDETALGQITYISIQLPKKLEFRVIAYRAAQPNAHYVYVDDFLIKCPYPPAFELTIEGDDLVYRNEKNQQILRKTNLRERLRKE